MKSNSYKFVDSTGAMLSVSLGEDGRFRFVVSSSNSTVSVGIPCADAENLSKMISSSAVESLNKDLRHAFIRDTER